VRAPPRLPCERVGKEAKFGRIVSICRQLGSRAAPGSELVATRLVHGARQRESPARSRRYAHGYASQLGARKAFSQEPPPRFSPRPADEDLVPSRPSHPPRCPFSQHAELDRPVSTLELLRQGSLRRETVAWLHLLRLHGQLQQRERSVPLCCSSLSHPLRSEKSGPPRAPKFFWKPRPP
jgi:hypothetical protein